jgi:hypothetical protein
MGGQGFDVRHGLKIYLVSGMSRLSSMPTQTHIQWVPATKQPGSEVANSRSCNAKVKNVWSFTASVPIYALTTFTGTNFHRCKSSISTTLFLR